MAAYRTKKGAARKKRGLSRKREGDKKPRVGATTTSAARKPSRKGPQRGGKAPAKRSGGGRTTSARSGGKARGGAARGREAGQKRGTGRAGSGRSGTVRAGGVRAGGTRGAGRLGANRLKGQKATRGTKDQRKKPLSRKPLTASQKRRREQAKINAKLKRLEAEREKLRRKLELTTKGKPSKRKRAEVRKKAQAEHEKVSPKPILSKKQKEEGKKHIAPWEPERGNLDRFKKRFKTLREKAKKAGQLPKPDYRKRRLRSDEIIGEQRVLKLNLQLHGNVEEIMFRARNAVRGMSGIYDLWLGFYCLLGMGERLLGYGQHTLKLDDPDAHHFQVGIDSTGVQPTALAMLDRLEEDLLDYAGEQTTVIHIEHLVIRNYSYLKR